MTMRLDAIAQDIGCSWPWSGGGDALAAVELPPPPAPPEPLGPLGPEGPPPAPPASLALEPAPGVGALFMSASDPVMSAGPSSMSTVNAPVMGATGPIVLRLTTSLSVPGSF